MCSQFFLSWSQDKGEASHRVKLQLVTVIGLTAIINTSQCGRVADTLGVAVTPANHTIS